MFDIYQKQWQFLKKSVLLGKVSHAYLFSGLGSGKGEMAKDFAKLFNCQNTSWETGACGRCLSCREFAKNCHSDLLFLEAPEASENEESEINLVRKLADRLSLKPILGQVRVAIIEAGETLSQPAQSALLKILEEPPGQSLLIILASFPDLLLPTIVSRAQKINFPAKAALTEKEKRVAKIFSKMLDQPQPLAVWFQKLKDESSDREKAVETLVSWMKFQRIDFKAAAFLKQAVKTHWWLTRTNVNCRLALENLILTLF